MLCYYLKFLLRMIVHPLNGDIIKISISAPSKVRVFHSPTISAYPSHSHCRKMDNLAYCDQMKLTSERSLLRRKFVSKLNWPQKLTEMSTMFVTKYQCRSETKLNNLWKNLCFCFQSACFLFLT